MTATSTRIVTVARASLLVVAMLLALAARQGAAASPPPTANDPCGSMMIEELGLVSDIHRSDACTSLMIEQQGLVSTNAGPAMTPSLVGSGPEREIVANSDRLETAGVLDETTRSAELTALTGGGTAASSGTLDGPSLVGSGPEREIVANSDRQETASVLSDADISAILRASGGSGAIPSSVTTASVLDGPSLVGSGPEREIVANSDGEETAAVIDETAGTASVAARTGEPF